MFDIVMTPNGGFAIESSQPIHASWTHLSVFSRMIGAGDPRMPDLSDDPRKKPALDGHVDRMHRRLLHALKRLKSKGLYADTLDRLYAMMAKETDAVVLSRYQMYAFAVDPYEEGTPAIPLSDDVWCHAIELTMMTHEFDVYSDPNAACTPAIYDHVPDLWLTVIAVATGTELPRLIKRLSTYRELLEEATDALRAKPDAAQKPAPEPTRGPTVDPDRDDVIKELRGQLAKERRNREKDRLGYERRIREIRAAVKSPEKPDTIQTPDEPVPDESPAAPTIHDLPDDGVIFVGGDHNLHKRLRLIYPEWTFLSTRNLNFQAQPTTRAIFVWSNQMSHAVQSRLDRLYGPDVPRLYVTKTNVGALDAEMTRLWSDHVEKTSVTTPKTP